jgi:hypothetical protein
MNLLKSSVPALVICAASSIGFAQAQLANMEMESKAAMTALAANLSSFPTFRCRFTDTRGIADSVDQALRGDLRNSKVCEYVLVVDGNRQVCRSTATVSPLPKMERPKTGKVETRLPVACSAFSQLRLRDEGLCYSPAMDTVYLHNKEMVFVNRQEGPLEYFECFRVAPLSPKGILNNCQESKCRVTACRVKVVDSRPVLAAEFQYSDSRADYYFDAERGFLPSQIDYWFKNGTIGGVKLDGRTLVRCNQIRLLDAQKCSNNRWFPTLVVMIGQAEKENLKQPVLVHRWKVTDLVVDERPPDSAFQVEIPAGTVVQWRDRDKPGGPFALRQMETVTPSDIPRLIEMLENKARQPLMDTAVRPKLKSRRWIWYTVGAVGLALGIAVIYRRRRLAARG